MSHSGCEWAHAREVSPAPLSRTNEMLTIWPPPPHDDYGGVDDNNDEDGHHKGRNNSSIVYRV